MEQVPKLSENPNYLIIGNGKLARHFSQYFRLEGIAFTNWSRSSKHSLSALVLKADIILVLISDDAIEDFYQSKLRSSLKPCLHFSGALVIAGLLGLHPLNMYGEDLLTLEEYKKQTFVCEEGLDFKTYFPSLTNSSFIIAAKDKAYYHALCVMAGNFTTFLWDKAQTSFEERLGLPSEILSEYMETVFNNLKRKDLSFTGPLVRKDIKTIEKNLIALEGDKYQGVYQSFVELKGINLKDQK